MSDPNEATIRRIKSLLAKRGAAGTTPQEVAAAVGQAMRLLEKIGLSMAELEDQDAAEPDARVLDSGNRRIATWLCLLAQETAPHVGCYTFKSGHQIVIVGTPENRDMAVALYSYCKAAIEDLTQKWKGMGRVFLGNFRLGCIHAIRMAIAEEKAAAREEFVAEGGALMVIEQRDQQLARAETLTKERLEIKSTTARSREHEGAYMQGLHEGRDIYVGRNRRVGSGE